MLQVQTELRRKLEDELSADQLEEYVGYGDHERKMTLLGRQLQNKLTRDQRVKVDSITKDALLKMDDGRIELLGLQPMTGTTYCGPPEETLQQAAQWRRMMLEEQELRRQGLEEAVEYDSEEDAEE